MFMYVNILHDYSDHISLKFCDKIQYEYYGRKGSLSKEGIDLDHLSVKKTNVPYMLSGGEKFSSILLLFLTI